MTWSELKRKAVKAGFKFVRSGKKHDIYVNPETGQFLQIERHWSQEVRKGLANSILKMLGE